MRPVATMLAAPRQRTCEHCGGSLLDHGFEGSAPFMQFHGQTMHVGCAVVAARGFYGDITLPPQPRRGRLRPATAGTIGTARG